MTKQSARLTVSVDSWRLEEPLRISFATLETIDVVVAELAVGGVVGRGEGVGVFYRDDGAEDGAVELRAAAAALNAGENLADVAARLTSFAARNAFDCARWDVRCKQAGTSIWKATDVRGGPVETCTTISLDTPERMAESARTRAGRRLKIKIDASDPVAQVAAVRAARPDAVLIADANQAFDFEQLQRVAPELAALDLQLLEQPLPAGEDAALSDYQAPLLLCADESCFTAADLDAVAPRYGAVNVKLDKTGGLTGALELQVQAQKRGLKTIDRKSVV